MSEAVGIGTRVWSFDVNRRVYRRDENGRAHGGPIYAEHFEPWRIVGEEGRSWIIERDTKSPHRWTVKIGKAALAKKYFTDGQRDGMIWANEHRHRLVRLVERERDIGKLKQVAAVLGYDDSEWT